MSTETFYSPKIIGTGSFLPKRMIPNLVLEQRMELLEGFIYRTVGVLERRSCRDLATMEFDFGDPKINPPEVAMGVLAAEKAIEDAQIDKKEITSVLFGAEMTSVIPDYLLEESLFVLAASGIKLPKREMQNLSTPRPGWGRPPVYQFLERFGLMGRVQIHPFQLVGCADLHYHLPFVSLLLHEKPGKVLVVASSAASILAEQIKPSTDLNDIITYSLFGDGASAMVLDFSTIPRGRMMTNYTSEDMMENPFSTKSLRDIKNYPQDLGLYINHRKVLDKAPEAMVNAIYRVLDQAGLSVWDIDHFLLHQASGPTYRRTLRLLKEQFGEIDLQNIPTNFETLSNTGFTSTLLLLDEGRHNGTIQGDQTLLMASAGAGFRSAALLLKA